MVKKESDLRCLGLGFSGSSLGRTPYLFPLGVLGSLIYFGGVLTKREKRGRRTQGPVRHYRRHHHPCLHRRCYRSFSSDVGLEIRKRQEDHKPDLQRISTLIRQNPVYFLPFGSLGLSWPLSYLVLLESFQWGILTNTWEPEWGLDTYVPWLGLSYGVLTSWLHCLYRDECRVWLGTPPCVVYLRVSWRFGHFGYTVTLMLRLDVGLGLVVLTNDFVFIVIRDIINCSVPEYYIIKITGPMLSFNEPFSLVF